MNYKKICSDLLKDLPSRSRDVIERRFGLKTGKRETLEAIGADYDITRERVRQIENEAFSFIKPKLEKNKDIIKDFKKVFASFGGVKREENLLNSFGKNKNCVLFLLTNLDDFKKMPESDEFYTSWYLNKESLDRAKKTVKDVVSKLKKAEKTLALNDKYLDISKKVEKGPNGKYGLDNWIEINPRGIKDKAYLVLKNENQPVHFTEVAGKIEKLPFGLNKVHTATVHNELIKDNRFVLVGRGLYALKEWGYQSGVVRDVIAQTIKEAKKPLSKEEILAKVSKQRFVKENTIALNLQNRNCFLRNSQGKYTIKEA